MAKHFNQKDIDQFKECFFFLQKRGFVESPEELEKLMQSLNFSPTYTETIGYFRKHNKNGKIDFANFLEVLHEHSKVENAYQEILEGFQAQDKDGKGVLPAAIITKVLTSTGERMSSREVNHLFQEAGMINKGLVDYKQLLQALMAPLPDYI